MCISSDILRSRRTALRLCLAGDKSMGMVRSKTRHGWLCGKTAFLSATTRERLWRTQPLWALTNLANAVLRVESLRATAYFQTAKLDPILPLHLLLVLQKQNRATGF
jgi:hypothetical protein